MESIKKAAELKFDGTVLEVSEKPGHSAYNVYICRHNPTFKDRPFMRITGYINQAGEPEFIWGHYDLESPADFTNHGV